VKKNKQGKVGMDQRRLQLNAASYSTFWWETNAKLSWKAFVRSIRQSCPQRFRDVPIYIAPRKDLYSDAVDYTMLPVIANE